MGSGLPEFRVHNEKKKTKTKKKTKKTKQTKQLRPSILKGEVAGRQFRSGHSISENKFQFLNYTGD